MKVLIVVDMQNDFIDGVLGTREAVAIVPHVKEKIEAYRAEKKTVIFTRDTHGEDYLLTQEGRKLPVDALPSRKPWMENIIETGYGGQRDHRQTDIWIL